MAPGGLGAGRDCVRGHRLPPSSVEECRRGAVEIRPGPGQPWRAFGFPLIPLRDVLLSMGKGGKKRDCEEDDPLSCAPQNRLSRAAGKASASHPPTCPSHVPQRTIDPACLYRTPGTRLSGKFPVAAQCRRLRVAQRQSQFPPEKCTDCFPGGLHQCQKIQGHRWMCYF
ncbi:shieldin complex subunit 1 isoform X1 [Ciconia boyciana]|uniref:shieldin complex subunit 1 isoform X1 n=1 Tax=Ciconia boyciana TaxID=52775 RepID=UPI003BA342FF